MGSFPETYAGYRFRTSSESQLKLFIVVLLKRAELHVTNLKELCHEI